MESSGLAANADTVDRYTARVRRSQMSPKRSLSIRASEVRPLSSLTLPPFIMGDSAVSWIGPVRSASVCPFCSSSPSPARRRGDLDDVMRRCEAQRGTESFVACLSGSRICVLCSRSETLSSLHSTCMFRSKMIACLGMDTGLANESFL